MTKTFRTYRNRLDRELVIFAAEDRKELLRDICTNSTTAHVRESKTGVAVPAHAELAVADHLYKLGWSVRM